MGFAVFFEATHPVVSRIAEKIVVLNTPGNFDD
jgi:hypothetical protein